MISCISNIIEFALISYRQDSSKRSELMSKYERFAMPMEEADWHGLSIDGNNIDLSVFTIFLPLQFNSSIDAREKQWQIEALHRDSPANTEPMKVAYRKELVQMLKEGYMDEVDPAILYDN